MVKYYQLDGIVVAHNEETGDMGAYIEFFQDDENDEPSFTTFHRCYVKDDKCLHIRSFSARKDSPFSSKAEFLNYYKSLPVWNKTKYYAKGGNYYSCLDFKEVEEREVYP